MREIPGPNPHEFGIIGRSRRLDGSRAAQTTGNEFLKELEAQHKLEAKEKIKTEFFRDIDRKAKEKRLRARVDNVMEARNINLYERRKRLRDLLENEQKSLEEEFITATLSSQLERAAILREKAKQIRQKRDIEQSAFVQEKLEQKWRSENDELRSFMSKQMQAGMKDVHMRQIEEKIALEQNRLEEEAMFANLWYQDANAKKEREDREKAELDERNRIVAEKLREKMKLLDEQKLEEKRLRRENAKLMHQKQEDDKIEKIKEYQDKLDNQANRRRELDLCLRAKQANQERLAQEELSFDLKMLEDALQSYQNEDNEKFERKKELFLEQKMYRDYLERLRQEEKQNEKELEAVVNKEIEKQFEKRLVQWRKDKENRKKLMQDVLNERGMQIRDKYSRAQEEEELARQEKEIMDSLSQMYKEDEKDQKLRARAGVNKYRDDLIKQIDYLNSEKSKEREQDWIDYKTSLQDEMAYQNRVIEHKKQILTDSTTRRF